MTHPLPIPGQSEGPPEPERLSLAWAEFNARFPTEDDCVDELCRIFCENGLLKCRYCGLSDPQRDRGDRVFRCLSCYKKTWFTAGTFFHRVRSARHWLAAIWLMERGLVLSSSKLHEVTGISQSNALNILKRIATVIQAHMDGSTQPVPSALFAQVLCKRSRETPARSHPLAELAKPEDEHVDDLPESTPCTAGAAMTTSDEPWALYSSTQSAQSPSNKPEAGMGTPAKLEAGETTPAGEYSAREGSIIDLLSEKPLHFDYLCQRSSLAVGELAGILIMLELEGIVTRQDGDHYVRSIPKTKSGNSRQSLPCIDPSSELASTVTTFVKFIRIHMHGISRKYLQKYLATHWYHFDRKSWQCGALLKACLRFPPITYEQIVSYVSPHLVDTVLCH